MKAIERLYKYIEFKGFKPTNFEKKAGLSSGYLSIQKKRNADIGETALNKINDYCRDLNLEWLLTGNGKMIKESEPKYSLEDKKQEKCPICQEKDTLITQLKSEISRLEKTLDYFLEIDKKEVTDARSAS